jgi:hypothetical protein
VTRRLRTTTASSTRVPSARIPTAPAKNAMSALVGPQQGRSTLALTTELSPPEGRWVAFRARKMPHRTPATSNYRPVPQLGVVVDLGSAALWPRCRLDPLPR